MVFRSGICYEIVNKEEKCLLMPAKVFTIYKQLFLLVVRHIIGIRYKNIKSFSAVFVHEFMQTNPQRRTETREHMNNIFSHQLKLTTYCEMILFHGHDISWILDDRFCFISK